MKSWRIFTSKWHNQERIQYSEEDCLLPMQSNFYLKWVFPSNFHFTCRKHDQKKFAILDCKFHFVVVIAKVWFDLIITSSSSVVWCDVYLVVSFFSQKSSKTFDRRNTVLNNVLFFFIKKVGGKMYAKKNWVSSKKLF